MTVATHQENQHAGSKTASRIFFAELPNARPVLPSQVTETHLESVTYVFDFAPGCVVAPNSPAVGGADINVTPRTGEYYPDGTPMRYGRAVGDIKVLEYEALTPVAPYEPWDGTMTYQTRFPTYQSPHVPNSNDQFRAIVDGFGQYHNALSTGVTLGNAAPYVAVAPIVIAEDAPVLIVAAKDLRIDGPQRGGRLIQLRYGNTPLVRLDYGRYPGSGGDPRLHLNIGPGKDNIHIPLDPRTWFGD